MPPKLKPCTVKTESTASFSFVEEVPLDLVASTCIVRSCVAPTGACTCANSDALVLGGQEGGRQAQEQHAQQRPASAAKIDHEAPAARQDADARRRW